MPAVRPTPRLPVRGNGLIAPAIRNNHPVQKVERRILYPLPQDESLSLGKLIHDRMEPEHEVIGFLVDDKIVEHDFDIPPRNKEEEKLRRLKDSIYATATGSSGTQCNCP